MKILFITALIFSFSQSIQAKSVRHRFDVPVYTDSGQQIYYNCDSVRTEVRAILRELRAGKISVSCQGGINPSNWTFSTAAYVTVSFETYDNGRFDAFSIRSFDSCHLYRTTLNEVKGFFTIKGLEATRRCYNAGERFYADGEVLN